MEGMDDCGEIKVTGTLRDGNVTLSVADNGVGMSEEEVNLALTDSNRIHKHGSGVGLVNVNNRIKLLFGEEYGISVYSHQGAGTDVLITLPLKRV